MITRRSTFFLGIFIFLIPFFGVPSSWKTTLTVLSALGLISLSITIPLPKKPVKRSRKKEKPVDIENKNMELAENNKISF